MQMLSGGGKPSPELEKAMAEMHGLGRTESHRIVVDGQRHALDQRYQGRRPQEVHRREHRDAQGHGRRRGPGKIYKDLKIEPAAQTDRGITFTHVAGTIDMEKLAELAGNVPAQVESLKAMFGDGKHELLVSAPMARRMLQVVAPSWEEARTMIDTYLKGPGGVGETAGFKAIRSELPEKASLLMLFSTQAWSACTPTCSRRCSISRT